MVYMAKVDDALTTKVTGLKCTAVLPSPAPLANWKLGFKIYEDGMDANGEWAVTRLYNNKGKVDFTLPSCIQSGQSVLPTLYIRLL